MLGDRIALQDDFNYVLQHPDRLLFRHLTLAQNLSLTRERSSFAKLSQEDIDAFFGGMDILTRFPWQCSVGQRQRAVLPRSLLDLPYFPVTLLDEPFASISRDSKHAIYRHFQVAVREASKVLLFVTHDISEACILADDVVVLNHGHTVAFDVSSVRDERGFLSASSLREKIQEALLTQNALSADGGDAIV